MVIPIANDAFSISFGAKHGDQFGISGTGVILNFLIPFLC